MKNLLCFLFMVLFSQTAMAQDSTTASGTAQAANNVTVVADAGRYAPADTSVKYSGHTWTTPNVGGSYFAGANPCLIGSGGGAAGGPIAFSFTSGRNDEGCQRRSDAGAWKALGFPEVAAARMCQDVTNSDSYYAATGEVCPGADAKRYIRPDGTIPPTSRLVNDIRK